jgi:hypothetical protein
MKAAFPLGTPNFLVHCGYVGNGLFRRHGLHLIPETQVTLSARELCLAVADAREQLLRRGGSD